MPKKKPTNMNETTTPAPSCILRCSCPHYCSSNRSCQLIQEGLFLPIDQHVASYCLSSHFHSCLHYQLLAGTEGETGQLQSEAANRRRSIRIPSNHTFCFSEITGHDQFPGLRENDAWTVDLSDHGIRFASRQLLLADTDIRFFLKTDDSAPLIEGIGRVVWCEPLENTPLYHAAISFNDQQDITVLPHHRYPQ